MFRRAYGAVLPDDDRNGGLDVSVSQVGYLIWRTLIMRCQNRFRLMAIPFLAATMMVSLGGCFYGGGGGERRGYGDGGGYYRGNGDDDDDDGMRSVPPANNLATTAAPVPINAPAKMALVLRHPRGQ